MNGLDYSLVENELNYINEELKSTISKSDIVTDLLENFLIGSSKCIRSIVTILYLKANNINITELSLKIMTVGEIIHNASLLHDDVLDDATTRRGVQSINKKYSSHLAILLGDSLLSFGIDKLKEIDKVYVRDTFISTTQKMCDAEIRQLFTRGTKPTVEKYISICTGKTALLFDAVIRSCSYVENLDIDRASNFALNLGVLFQLKNDFKKESRTNDKLNQLSTLVDIIGVEKTRVLMDNYSEEVFKELSLLDDSCYKRGLEGIVKEL